MKRVTALMVECVAALSLVACSGGGLNAAPPRSALVLSTGWPGEDSYDWGVSLAQQLQLAGAPVNLTVESSSGSVANLRRLTIGTADLGLTTADAIDQQSDACVTQAAAGAFDERRVPLRALARIYDDYLQIIVPARSPIRTVADLAGRRVVVGETGSGTSLVACRVLLASGIRVDQIAEDVGPGLSALQAGTVDAVFWFGGLPTDAIATAASTQPLRLLPLGALADTMRLKYGAVYRPATIPAGRYASKEPIATLASPNILVSRADASSSLVNAVLSTMFARANAIADAVAPARATDRRTAILTGGVALHPAAVAYYRRTEP